MLPPDDMRADPPYATLADALADGWGDDAAAPCPECKQMRDLLRRIRDASINSTLDIPDVAHAVEAEINDMLDD